jgi:hypothetical protein
LGSFDVTEKNLVDSSCLLGSFVDRKEYGNYHRIVYFRALFIVHAETKTFIK